MKAKLTKAAVAGMAAVMIAALPAAAGNTTRMSEAQSTAESEEIPAKSVSHGYSHSEGTSINGGFGPGVSHSSGTSFGWSTGVSADTEGDDMTFGWFDTEGFHVATSENLDRIDADNESERELAEKTNRVYGWLDEEGFHPVEDMFDENGEYSDELRGKMDEVMNRYDEIRADIERAKNEVEMNDTLDETGDRIDDSLYDDYEDDGEDDYDEDYEDYDEYDEEDEDLYDDENDEDEESELYEGTLINTIDALSDTVVSEAGDPEAESLIGDREPSWIVVEEDVFNGNGSLRRSSKGTVSGKQKNEAPGSMSEGNSFSATFGAEDSEGMGTVNGRRIYYIYDLRDEN